MPVSTETRTELNLTIFTPTREAPFNEVIQALESFYEGTPTVNVIWDCSQATGINILSRELQEAVQYVKKYTNLRPSGKTAAVTDSTLKYGLARMTSTFAELAGLPWKIKIFKTLDAALAWIEECRQAETQEN